MKKWNRALVTGAANGLGRALSLKLLQMGTEVVALDKNEIAYENENKLLKRLKIDFINSKEVNSIFDTFDESHKFDLVIQNAGISATGKFEDIHPEAYENLLCLNLEKPIQINVQMMQNHLFAEKANLVFISSLSHATGYPGASVYAASKDAIAIYAKSIRKPFARVGIAVTTIFPGPIRTDHAERHAPEGASVEKRMLPEDVAERILRAASRGKKSLYPGHVAQLSRILGSVAPRFTTNVMRKLIYDKLKGSAW